jgi:transposase InsO family protein
LAHDTLRGDHLGSKKCLQRIKMSFWWPTICEDVRAWCSSCKECQLRKRITRFDRVLISAVVRPETFKVMNCDAIGPFEQKSTRGHGYVLVLVDQCSRWVGAIPLRSLTAKAACDAMLEVFARTGIPKMLISDNKTNFTARLSVEFRERLGCVPRFSTSRHPEGNSSVQRHNASVKPMLHHVIRKDPRNWDRQLPIRLWTIRDISNEPTGLSPYQIGCGKLGHGPSSVLRVTWAG